MARSDDRKPTSNYHSPLRAKQAAATRRSVVYAALDLFGEHGWTATTLTMIAARAGVSVDTIHVIFRTKSALLMAVVEVAIVGDDGEARMVERADFAAVGVGRRSERLRTAVRYAIAAYERSVPILDTLREAAASDDAARARLIRYDQDRLDLVAAGVELILGHEPAADVVDAVWTLLSPEVITHLVTDRRWSSEQAEDWLIEMLKVALRSRRS